MNKEEIKELLEKLKQCDDFHNRCDFLMEHSEITYMLDYITKLQQENQKLKKQLDYLRRSIERKEETIIDLQNERVPYVNEYVEKLKNQQKEFIEFLESYLKLFDNKDIYEEGSYDTIEEILSKYKEIIKFGGCL